MHSSTDTEHSSRRLAVTTVAALGVVFGDIGTSPLYAFRECFSSATGISPLPYEIMGVLSLMLWSLIIVVSVKYLVLVLRADNKGEGGVLSLMSLAQPRDSSAEVNKKRLIVYLGLCGAALIVGDGMITPAISILSAVEGLNVATTAFESYVLPITMAIHDRLFFVQSRGTAKIGSVFGPVIFIWFLALGIFGMRGILLQPSVLQAINPFLGLSFLYHHGWVSLHVLGGVFLVTTGAEALYADMGHFGRSPIRIAWFLVVFPSLVLNYFGQGAMLIHDPSTISNPFYLLAPSWALYPMVVLATAAAVIASQAMISGVFSMTSQAVRLGYFPRVAIRHTSSHSIGQIYVPQVNRLLFLSTIALVVAFGSSSNLAAAYGIAVSITMITTTILIYFVAVDVWGWTKTQAAIPCAIFFVIDGVFLVANFTKLLQGGWVALMIGALVFTVMSTWWRGRQVLAERLRAGLLPFESFVRSISDNPPVRVPGTAIFMSRSIESAPPCLIHSVTHNKSLHERVFALLIKMDEVPHVDPSDRVQYENLGHGFYRLIAHYGFMDTPDVPELLERVREQGLDIEMDDTTFYVGRETLIATDRPGMALWREELFAFMSRNAQHAKSFFNIPAERVFEVGVQVEL